MNLDFGLAIKQILNDDYAGHNPVPDPLCFDYLRTHKEEIINYLNELNLDDYPTKPLLTIDVPKANFTIRPMGRPDLKDWIIYQAIINNIIPLVVKSMSKRNYSILRFENPKSKIDPWLKFDEKSREFYSSGFKYALTTDISSYFENIDLEELRNKLLNYQPRNEVFKMMVDFLIRNLLCTWSTGRIRSFGLPQGPSASSFLGDFYLDSIDSEMEKEQGYFRFMDDIRIFCKSEFDAKKSLIKLIRTLRKYKLNINAKKTRILKNKEIPLVLFDPKKPILDGIQAAFDSKNPDKIKSVASILVDDVFYGGFSENDLFNDRHINFAVYRLGLLNKSGIDFDEKKVKDLILNYFIDKPHQSKLFCDLLILLPEKEETLKFLLKFIESRDNIYEWQELHVLRSIIRIASTLNKRQVAAAFKKLNDKNTHWSLRVMYCLMFGKYTSNRSRDNLIDLFDNNDNQEFKKSIVIAIQELGVGVRNDFYNDKKGEIFPHTFINFMKGLKNPVYFKAYDLASLDFIGQVERKYS